MRDPELRRSEFEAEYRRWIRSTGGDVALRLRGMDPVSREDLLGRYRALEDPIQVFHPLSDPERVDKLSGGVVGFVFLETDAVTIFPSIFVAGALDFAVAMNRRFYVRGLWFNVIALNSEYVRRSSDKMLAFALHHELEMARLFEEGCRERLAPGNGFTPGEKRSITESAQKSAAGKLNITPDELREDEGLMLSLADTEPLIPKPYGEMALHVYLEENYEDLEHLGVQSAGPEEESMGQELLSEFSGWRKFSHSTFILFVREIVQRLREGVMGYA